MCITLACFHIRTHCLKNLHPYCHSLHSGRMSNLNANQPDAYMPRSYEEPHNSPDVREPGYEPRYEREYDQVRDMRFKQKVREKIPRKDCIFILTLGARGGIGTSTWSLQCARFFVDTGTRACAIDADFAAGGLDVLAGCEEMEGLRWHNVKAPLGTIDERGFADELLCIDDLSVLPAHPWNCNGNQQPWWQIKAVLEAAAYEFSIVVIDCGRAFDSRLIKALESLEAHVHVVPIVITSMDILGAARAQSLLHECELNRSIFDSPVVLGSTVGIGYSKRGLFHKHGKLESGLVDDVALAQFLGVEIFGVISKNPKVSKYFRYGWGIPPLSAEQRILCNALSDVCINGTAHDNGAFNHEHEMR